MSFKASVTNAEEAFEQAKEELRAWVEKEEAFEEQVATLTSELVKARSEQAESMEAISLANIEKEKLREQLETKFKVQTMKDQLEHQTTVVDLNKRTRKLEAENNMLKQRVIRLNYKSLPGSKTTSPQQEKATSSKPTSPHETTCASPAASTVNVLSPITTRSESMGNANQTPTQMLSLDALSPLSVMKPARVTTHSGAKFVKSPGSDGVNTYTLDVADKENAVV